MSSLLGTARSELRMLAVAMAIALAVVVAYVLITDSAPTTGDQPTYHEYGRLFTEGKWWWTSVPFDVPHPSAWKAPLYPAWVGLVYAIAGVDDLAVELAQALLAPLTVLLTWLLARRLFGPVVAIASAFVVALFPLAWEFYGRLYPEALAIPLVVGTVAVFLGREPSPRLVVAAGALLGVNVLLRPSSVFLAAGMLVAWIVAAGPARGIRHAAVAAVVAALVVAPWTIRNAVVLDGFIPISVQDSAAYGTFNEVSASDPDRPYAWRLAIPQVADLLDRRRPVPEPQLRSRFREIASDYVRDHPMAVGEAFFWNGIVRFWDLRRPRWALEEVDVQGRSRPVVMAGLAAYYVLLPLAAYGLWRLRRRRELFWPLVAMAAAASVVTTVVAVTRYRAPLEPLIAMLAVYGVADWLRRSSDRRRTADEALAVPSTAPSTAAPAATGAVMPAAAGRPRGEHREA